MVRRRNGWNSYWSSRIFLRTEGCAEVIQTNFESKFPNMEGEELDASTKLGKVKKLAKIKMGW